MKTSLLYLIEVLFCSGVLLAFYRLLLVRRVSFRACRRYLLAALALSVVIPALDIPLYPAPEPIPGSVAEPVFPEPPAATPRPAADDAPRLEVCLSRDSMWIDGTPGTGDDLLRRIVEKRDSLSEEERSRMTVTIRDVNEVQMGAVADVKELLRRSGTLRVRYETVDSRAEIDRALSFRIGTLPDGSDAKADIWEFCDAVPADSKHPDSYRLTMAERNCFMVLINARGEILAGTWGHLELCDVEALKVRAREFMLNPSDDRTLSESRPQEILLPDGRTEQYGVSRGVFGIQTTRKTPYAVYTDVQQALSEVYAGLRTDLSRQWFGQPFDALDEAQRRSVQQAVPVRISEVSRNFATK